MGLSIRGQIKGKGLYTLYQALHKQAFLSDYFLWQIPLQYISWTKLRIKGHNIIWMETISNTKCYITQLFHFHYNLKLTKLKPVESQYYIRKYK